jgi:dynein heavy chain 1, cytosolic
LRHCPVLLVDYPGQDSLLTIYGTFVKAALHSSQNLRGYADIVSSAMVEFFTKSKKRFTPDIHSHYIYSPRELTRWVRGLLEILSSLEFVTLEDLIRMWAHEALRLFQDRLITEEEKSWSRDTLLEVAEQYFPNTDLQSCLCEPILFSNFLSRNYVSVDKVELFEFISARLVSYEEETNVKIILYKILNPDLIRR